MGSTFQQYSLETSSKDIRNNSFGHNSNSKFSMPRKFANKRKLNNEFDNMNSNNNNYNYEANEFSNSNYDDINNHSNNNIRNKYRINKRQKNPNEIFGRKLPLNRIIETLNKEKLQKLINSLIIENPEITSKILDISPKITPNDALIELKCKLDLILINMPYKVESTSDYSFLRVKPLVKEFFESLSDYSLNFISPIENDLTISINFLKKFLIEIFHKLPKFQAVEFKYFYNLTIEKFNLIFNNNITQFLTEKKQNILLIINENWITDFKKINELNNNTFIKIENLLKEEINKYYNSGSVILNNDTIDVNENKLTGLDNLLNFAYQNNPLSNNV